MAEIAGDAALLADPRDPAALAAAIGRALDDDDLRAKLRASGPRRAAAFTWARTAAGTRAVVRRDRGRWAVGGGPWAVGRRP